MKEEMCWKVTKRNQLWYYPESLFMGDVIEARQTAETELGHCIDIDKYLEKLQKNDGIHERRSQLSGNRRYGEIHKIFEPNIINKGQSNESRYYLVDYVNEGGGSIGNREVYLLVFKKSYRYRPFLDEDTMFVKGD